jgi:hypothetical protein
MTMTRISSLFVATTLAILPLSAFAQTAPAKTAAPTNMTTTTNTTAPAAGKTSEAAAGKTSQPAKPAVKDPAGDTKTQVHGMNTVKTHHAKAPVSAKTADPLKS